MIVLDGETIDLPHLFGEDYRLHGGNDNSRLEAEEDTKMRPEGRPALPAAEPTVRFSRIPKVKIESPVVSREV